MSASASNIPAAKITANCRAFTLIELMLAIFLVLILMIGVNYVFRTATDAVGTGQASNTIAREQAASQPILFSDFASASKNPPCFIIASQIMDQFLNSADAAAAVNPKDPTVLDDGSTVAPGIYNYRQHRVDLVKFFAHGYYPRRGANPGAFTTSESSDDAFITIGHLMLPSNDGTYYMGPTTDYPISSKGTATDGYRVQEYVNPGTSPPNNPCSIVVTPADSTGKVYPTATQRVGAYASDWVLGRNAVLLKDPAWFSMTNTGGGAQSGGFTTGSNGYGAGASQSVPEVVRPLAVPASGTSDVYYFSGYNGANNANYETSPTNNLPRPYSTQLGTTTPAAYPPNMAPLCSGTMPVAGYQQGTVGTVAPQDDLPFEMSRYDLAATTPDEFRRTIANAILNWQSAGYGGASLWWAPLVYNLEAFQGSNTFAQYNTPPVAANLPTDSPSTVGGGQSYTPSYPYASSPIYAYDQTAGGTVNLPAKLYSFTPDGTNFYNPELARMAANPLLQTPISSASLAQIAPYFIQHCSQFIVEYAGDYLQQDNNPLYTNGNLASVNDPNAGAITGLGPDGQIDYVLDINGNKQIRWYGMPRKTSSASAPVYTGTSPGIRGFAPGPSGDVAITPVAVNNAQGTSVTLTAGAYLMSQKYQDVIPLRDYYTYYYNLKGKTGDYAPPWEVDVNFAPYGNYADTTMSGNVPNNPFMAYGFSSSPYAFQPRYVAAWYNDMPAMIRILIKVDDPNNKVKDGPWYEYVFKLK